MKDLRGRRVLVVGLGRSGREVARCLTRRGARVTVTDARPPSAFAADIPGLLAQKVGLELGRHDEETFLRHDLIVVSPGVPWDSPYLAAARRRRIPVLPEVELAASLLPGTLVGITGSNGKTTTTALLGKILQTSRLPAFVGGNIGVPLISAVDNSSAETLLVTELSSFQLEAAENLRPRVAVLLNLTPNHLDRHPSFEAYVEAKARIFRRQTAGDYAVLNADDPRVAALAPGLRAQKIFFSRRQSLADGVLVQGGRILYRRGNLERALMETREVPLRGAFNIENVLAASAAACLLGADFGALRRAVREFEGVEHRLEFVREIRGVSFFNDSKATSVDAAAKALSAFPEGVHVILGGKDKGAPYAPLRPLMKTRVRAAYLIGAAQERLARELAGAVELVRAGDLETALRQASARAVPGEVVLLAPACSSFDQFQDFEHRGRAFKEIVARLAEEPAPQPRPASPPAAVPPSPPVEQGTPPPSACADSTEQNVGKDGSALAGTCRPVSPDRTELVYVYEVSEEDAAPLDFDLAADSEFPALDPADLAAPEELADEQLMFEIRSGGNGDPAARAVTASARSEVESRASLPEPPAGQEKP
jgi:UDP-N-acetylmuramoylalanine--D-glutamate ligase